jgi:NADPH-dependent 2,4-dienoyl-CoA reductase/sulfur reductase-like enzyme
MRVPEIFVRSEDEYRRLGVTVILGRTVTAVDADAKTVETDGGEVYGFSKLLLATGAAPRRLAIPGGDLPDIFYYRTLGDYRRLRPRAVPGSSAVVVGGGFIGSELAAALHDQGVAVTMVFPEPALCGRVFPEPLGLAMTEFYRSKGVTVITEDKPKQISRLDGRLTVTTEAGLALAMDMVIAGIGVAPATSLAESAGLTVGDGIVVNEMLQTSQPDIYAAGDNALFPSRLLGTPMRLEHWDNSVSQGKAAGRNMAGASEPFAYQPYFYSDLFDFGYEAVGLIDSRLDTVEDWQQKNRTGVVYYLETGRVRGVMCCNVWDQMDAARALIGAAEVRTPQSLRGAIAIKEANHEPGN